MTRDQLADVNSLVMERDRLCMLLSQAEKSEKAAILFYLPDGADVRETVEASSARTWVNNKIQDVDNRLSTYGVYLNQ